MGNTWQTSGAGFETAPLPAAASHGIAPVLEGPPVPGRIAGKTASAMWLSIGDDIIVVTDSGGARLPNGVSTPAFSEIPTPRDDHCVAGESRIRLEGAVLDVVRWWQPRPSLQPTTHEAIAARCMQARSELNCDLEVMPLRFDGKKVLRRSARELLGRGQGLTPEGDDILVGVFAALSLIGPSLGDTRAKKMLSALAPIIRVEAPFRTTLLSTSLLRHATAGEVAAPVASFIGALTGRGDIGVAVAEIRSMGATSGTATACGILVTAEALAKGAAA